MGETFNSSEQPATVPPFPGETRSPAAGEPRIGVDEWAAQVETRRRRPGGWQGRLHQGWESMPAAGRYGMALLLLVLMPFLTANDLFLDVAGISDNSFILTIANRFLIFALLAIGLNVIVGYAGLLDLGYVAFYGIAGYLYAYLSSEFVRVGAVIPYGLAIPAIVSLPLIVVAVSLTGWAIGAVSLRLTGDYLAIVTLGFGLIFVQLLRTATRVNFPWLDRPVDLTRGPNGINNLDDISLLGFTFSSSLHYYFLFVVLLVLVYVTVDRLNRSRIGRAWRSLREDELAAEVMGTPTRRLKLLAFAIGAGIAGLAGAVEAAWLGNVVPEPRYGVLTLINLYAMVVLGGIGSLPGAVLGALIFTVLPELLRSIALAGLLFYGLGLAGLVAYLRPWRRLLTVLAGTLAAGYLFKFLVNAIAPGLDAGYPPAGSVLNQAVQGWLVIPTSYTPVGNVVVWLALFLLLGAVLARRTRWHDLLLGTTIYAFAFAWETRLALEPSATRILIVGASLVILMIVRPQGLLGKTEVKVI